MKKVKTKNGDAQKKRSSRRVRGVSPEAGRSLWWERFVKRLVLSRERKREGVMDGETGEMTK